MPSRGGAAAERWGDAVLVRAFRPRMVCTRCGIVGADARPNWLKMKASGKLANEPALHRVGLSCWKVATCTSSEHFGAPSQLGDARPTCTTVAGPPVRGLPPRKPSVRIALRTRGTLAPTSAAMDAISGLPLAWQNAYVSPWASRLPNSHDQHVRI